VCRLFALRANQPTRVRESLLAAPCSLLRQSGCDRLGLCHDNGWGLGWYEQGRPVRQRAAAAAQQDPRYRAAAESLRASTALAHVRQASVGGVSERNTHPFVHGPWLFAHNGTLQGFAEDAARLRRLIPADLRRCIQGDTDSEHLFYYLLGRLGPVTEAAGRGAAADTVAEVVRDSLHTLAGLFPGDEAAPTRLNVVLTDGATLVATRWGHTLFWLERRGAVAADGPVEPAPAYHALAVGSEPTTTETGWAEVPDRSVLLIRPDLSHALTPITTPAR
jgi:predicted glutamine amidotransferase